MSKTTKKTKKDDSKEKMKSYVVTETGLVEDTVEVRPERRNSAKTLLSFIGVEDAKKKLKSLAERRRSTMSTEDPEGKKGLEKLKVELKNVLETRQSTFSCPRHLP